MADSLRNKAVRGAGWSFADSFLGQGITFLVGLVLARLLTPDEYGLIGIITIFITVLNSIVDSGFSNALIRKPHATRDDYNTMFITNLVFSILMFLLLFFSAPAIAAFFKRPELVNLTRVMGIVVIFNALSIVQNTILTKHLDFKTKTKASLISAIVSGIIGIGMAIKGFGVWSLVGQALSRQLVNSLCLWLFNRWWPQLKFCWDSFKEMWSFGWKLLVSKLIDTTWNELYQVVVGKFYSPATLGQYTRGKQFAQILSANITSVVQRVSFPTLSEIQDERTRLVNAYRKIIRTTMFVTTPLMFALAGVAHPFIYCLIGPQWDLAASFLPLICISMSLYPLHAINLNMLQVQGRSDLFLKLEIVKKAIAVGPILLGIFLNIYWMLIGTIISGFFSFFLNSYYSGRMIGYSSMDQIKDILPFYGLGFSLAVSVYFFRYLPLSNYIILSIQLIIGIIVFIGICLAFKINEYQDVKQILHQYVSKVKR